MDKPITFNEWLGTQGNIVLLHANCCRIAFEGGQQSMQEKVCSLEEHVEELQKLVNKALTKLDQKRDELWSKWKENADVKDQGAANAFEEAYWILEQVLNGENNE